MPSSLPQVLGRKRGIGLSRAFAYSPVIGRYCEENLGSRNFLSEAQKLTTRPPSEGIMLD
jgi:hypothetical protein